ncbi:hypothetical protein HUJ04_006821 [Dendroctonus ponderosae]
MSMLQNSVLGFILLMLLSGLYGEKILHRDKRYLVFPFQGTFKTVYSFAVPWKLGPKQEMGVGWNFQFQYALPNSTDVLTNYPPSISRETRDINDEVVLSDRKIFYDGVESMLDSRDINGRECLLRTICENQYYSHFDDESGLLGQILHVFLTPNSKEGPDPELDEIYSDAQKAGVFGADCSTAFPKCNMERSFFDTFAIFGQ